jgi:hypothetical protein|tara:strand:+ start:720 stop:1097 length:378 start_codon:yes stop_codon:yes gene_type:complete
LDTLNKTVIFVGKKEISVMSKKKGTKKATINPTKSTIVTSAAQETAAAKLRNSSSDVLLFNKTTYMYILGGIGLMVIGFFLMAGGHNDDPNVFDEDVIYSTRRTLIAPIFILAGLVVQILAIFKK